MRLTVGKARWTNVLGLVAIAIALFAMGGTAQATPSESQTGMIGLQLGADTETSDDPVDPPGDMPEPTGSPGIVPLDEPLPCGSLGASAASDLSNFVTGVVIRDLNGNVITDGSLFTGQNYTFSISFAEDGSDQFAYDGGCQLTYMLPSALTILNGVQEGNVTLPNNAVVGWYNINTDGSVEVWFGNLDNTGAPISANFIDRYQNASFTLDLQAEYVGDGSGGQIDFGNGIIITIKDTSDQPASVQVNKQASKFDPVAESLDFTVAITAVGGPIDQVTLTDAQTLSGDAIPAGGYQIPSSSWPAGSGTYQYRVRRAGGTTGPWTDITPTWNGADAQFDFSSVGTLQAGDYIELRYTMPLSDALDALSITPTPSNAYIERLMYKLNLNNSATAHGREVASGTMKTDTAETNTALNKAFLAKAGSSSVVGGNNQITWAATAGDGSRSLNGQAIVDTLGANASTDLQTITGNITVQLYGYDPSTGTFTGPQTVTITPPAGLTAFNATGGFTYTVPNGYGSITDIRKVVFTYQTIAPESATTQSYQNDLSIGLSGGNTSTAGSGVVVGTAITTGKSSGWVFDASGNPTAIHYSVTVTIADGQKDQNIWLQDALRLTNSISDSASDPFHPTNTPTNVQITLSPAQPDFACYLFTSGSGQAYRWNLVFGPGVTTTSASTWQYDTEETLTIAYDIPLSSAVFDAGSDTVLDFLKDGHSGSSLGSDDFWYLNNQVLAYVGNQYVSDSRTTDFWPIRKEVDYYPLNKSIFEYTVYVNPQPAYVDIDNTGLFTAGPGTSFSDSFDPRMEYVPGSFYVLTSDTVDSGYASPPQAFGPYVGATGSQVGSAGVTEDGAVVVVDDEMSTLTVDFSKLTQLNWTGDLPTSTIAGSTSATWYTSDNPSVLEIHYMMRIKPEFLAPPQYVLNIANTATVHPSSSSKYGSHPFSSSSYLGYWPNQILKSLESIDGSVVSTTVEINPYGADMVPDDPPGLDKSRFTAYDEISGDLAIYLSSIEIYTKGGSPGNWDANWKTTPETLSNVPGDIFSVEVVDATHINFVLPNQVPIRITYKAQITAPAGSPATFNNSMTVYGWNDYYHRENIVVSGSSGDAWGSDIPVTLYKVDAGTGDRLDGAQFSLYVDSAPPNYVASPAHPAITVNGVNFYYITDGDPLGSGVYQFTDETYGALYANSSSSYLLVETAAPPDHALPASPDNRTYFVMRPLGDDEQAALQAKLGIAKPVLSITDNLTCVNEETSGGPSLPETGGGGLSPNTILGLLLITPTGVVLRQLHRNRGWDAG